jgi:hypothetical protein
MQGLRVSCRSPWFRFTARFSKKPFGPAGAAQWLVIKMAAEMIMPEWVDRMKPGCWYRISGDRPDLGLAPTARGTRYLQDTDPARDESINPARALKEKVRRRLGRRPYSPWQGRCGFPAITEAWNGAVFASRFGAGGGVIIFGGGHDDYFGSSVHAFDLTTRQWTRLSDGYISGTESDYGAGAVYPDSVYPDGSPLPPHTYGYVQYDPVGNDYILFKGQIELGPQVRSVPIPNPFNLLGVKGVGECGTNGAPPSVANALMDALAPLGIDHVDMPYTAPKLWKLIRQADGKN